MIFHSNRHVWKDLASAPRWVAWQTEDREEGKAPTKVPYMPGKLRRRAEADNPHTWGPRAAAVETAAALPRPYGTGGVGLELGDLGNGLGIGGIDLDACLTDGLVARWADDLLRNFATYAEVSPSGCGIKLFFFFDILGLPELQRVMGTKTGKKWCWTGGDHPPAIELYFTGRYFTVTDQWVPEAPASLRTVPQERLLQLIQRDAPAFLASDPGKASGRETGSSKDGSRSAIAMRLGGELRRSGKTFDEMCAAMRGDPSTAAWCQEKGDPNGCRELRRIWDKAGAEAWQAALARDEAGKVMPSLANAALALRSAPDLTDLICYDQMLGHSLLRRPVPDSRLPRITTPRLLQDTDVSALQEWLQRHGIPRLGKEVSQQAIDQVAAEQPFHPVRVYLSGLRWDGTPRLDQWLSYYLGAEFSPYTATVGRWFLMAMVARIMRPGCKADFMLVLEGAQGSGKSSAIKILAGDWFSDTLPDLHHGDPVRLSMHLRGKWLIEIAELSAFGKAEQGCLKAFLTCSEERYTPKYARNEVVEPRQCLFIGSTNKAAYLRDETGARRFWPVTTGSIDLEALREDRDQLFAEAVTAFNAGQSWWPDRAFEAEHIQPEQDDRFEVDAWESVIADWLSTQIRCTVVGVAQHALSLDMARIGTADQRRITTVLERLGWQRGRRGHGGVRYWVPRLGDAVTP